MQLIRFLQFTVLLAGLNSPQEVASVTFPGPPQHLPSGRSGRSRDGTPLLFKDQQRRKWLPFYRVTDAMVDPNYTPDDFKAFIAAFKSAFLTTGGAGKIVADTLKALFKPAADDLAKFMSMEGTKLKKLAEKAADIVAKAQDSRRRKTHGPQDPQLQPKNGAGARRRLETRYPTPGKGSSSRSLRYMKDKLYQRQVIYRQRGLNWNLKRKRTIFKGAFPRRADLDDGDLAMPAPALPVADFTAGLDKFKTVIVDEGIVFTAEKVNALFTPSHEAIAAIIALGEATSPTDAQPLMQKLVTILVANAGDITAWADRNMATTPDPSATDPGASPDPMGGSDTDLEPPEDPVPGASPDPSVVPPNGMPGATPGPGGPPGAGPPGEDGGSLTGDDGTGGPDGAGPGGAGPGGVGAGLPPGVGGGPGGQPGSGQNMALGGMAGPGGAAGMMQPGSGGMGMGAGMGMGMGSMGGMGSGGNSMDGGDGASGGAKGGAAAAAAAARPPPPPTNALAKMMSMMMAGKGKKKKNKNKGVSMNPYAMAVNPWHMMMMYNQQLAKNKKSKKKKCCPPKVVCCPACPCGNKSSKGKKGGCKGKKGGKKGKC